MRALGRPLQTNRDPQTPSWAPPSPKQPQEQQGSFKQAVCEGGNPRTHGGRGTELFKRECFIKVLVQGRASQDPTSSSRLSQIKAIVREQQMYFRHPDYVLSPFAFPAGDSCAFAAVTELSCSPACSHSFLFLHEHLLTTSSVQELDTLLPASQAHFQGREGTFPACQWEYSALKFPLAQRN